MHFTSPNFFDVSFPILWGILCGNALAVWLAAVITAVEYCKSAFGHCSLPFFRFGPCGDRATSLWARKAPTTTTATGRRRQQNAAKSF